MKVALTAWFDGQLDLDPEKLIFIDETKMVRLYGRAPRGERCRAAIPHGHWKTTTLTAGLRIGGLAAPMVMDGPMHGDAFRAYVEQALMPELTPVDVFVMDNPSRHTRSAVFARRSRPQVRSNPIERAFAKLKALLRAAATRTIPDLWDAIRDAIAQFTPDEWRNYFAAAGYDAF